MITPPPPPNFENLSYLWEVVGSKILNLKVRGAILPLAVCFWLNTGAKTVWGIVAILPLEN